MIIVIWFTFCILVALYARKKNRSGLGIFLLSVLLSPLAGLIVAALMKDKNPIAAPAPTVVYVEDRRG